MHLSFQMPQLLLYFNIQYLIIMMILLDRYELIKAIGDQAISVGFGSYGQVKLAKDIKTGKNVAVKIVHKLAKNQVVFHQQLYHPNIIQLLGYLIDKEQYADGGTLFEKIRNEKPTKKQIKSYFKDVCQAVAYLHQNQIMHRDIKPQNILLTGKGHAKLCDFGFAAILGERKTLCGTYEYMSPEMVQNKPYDYKIDIWALGILLFQLISGKAPFKGNSPDEVLDQMKTKIFFNERFTSQEIQLIKSILRVTPNKRPTIKQILDNPYFHDDSASTKESEVQVKEKSASKLNAVQLNQLHMPKPQQNSYPFYIPKMKQQQQNFPVKVADRSFGQIQRNQAIQANQNFGTGIKPQPIVQPCLDSKQVSYISKQNFNNNSFNSGGVPIYHKN